MLSAFFSDLSEEYSILQIRKIIFAAIYIQCEIAVAICSINYNLINLISFFEIDVKYKMLDITFIHPALVKNMFIYLLLLFYRGNLNNYIYDSFSAIIICLLSSLSNRFLFIIKM